MKSQLEEYLDSQSSDFTKFLIIIFVNYSFLIFSALSLLSLRTYGVDTIADT